MVKDVRSIGLSSHNLNRCRYSSSQFFESGNTCELGEGSKIYELAKSMKAHAGIICGELTGIAFAGFL